MLQKLYTTSYCTYLCTGVKENRAFTWNEHEFRHNYRRMKAGVNTKMFRNAIHLCTDFMSCINKYIHFLFTGQHHIVTFG